MPMAVAYPLTTALGEGIVQIRLPMAGNPLRYINGYVLDDDDGCTLVDCGWKADDVLVALHEGLAEVGKTLADVRRLLLTHFHFDHYGLAGTLVAAGIPLLAMHARDWSVLERIGPDRAADDAIADAWIARNGFRAPDGERPDDLEHHRFDFVAPTRLLDDGESVGRLRAMWTPGHSPGHLCYLDMRSGKILTGDHVLDPITPHVGVWHDHGRDPLGEYIGSLHRIGAMPNTGALPAHGEPFPDLSRRTDELLAHEAEREQQVLAVLRARGTTTGGDVARALKWRRRGDSFEMLPPVHQQFAVAETIAHLEHLHAAGTIERDRSGDPITYTLKPDR